MSFRKRSVLAAAFASSMLVALPALAAETGGHEAREASIKLPEVPQAAVDAARKALGVKITGAKRVTGEGGDVYEPAGRDGSGKEVEVHVSADGKVLKREGEEHEG